MSLYTINKDTKIGLERTKQNYLRAGIQSDVEFIEAQTGKTATGNTFLNLRFSKDEVPVQFTDYPRPITKPLNTMSKEELETYEKSISDQMSVLAQFVIAITGDKQIISGESFEEIAESLVTLLSKYKGALVRVKVVYDNKGWSIVPSRTWWTKIVESMSIPKEESEIEMLPGDKVVRPKRDIEKKEDNPLLSEIPTSEDKTEELPF